MTDSEFVRLTPAGESLGPVPVLINATHSPMDAGHAAMLFSEHLVDSLQHERIASFDPDQLVYKELRILGALGVDVAAYRAAIDLLVSHRYTFAELPRMVVGLGGVAELLETMAGERSTPPVHAVVDPSRVADALG